MGNAGRVESLKSLQYGLRNVQDICYAHFVASDEPIERFPIDPLTNYRGTTVVKK